jgi:Fe(II)/alpha-ketoglutarate-dependent arginine beta-hydroxylase
VCHLIPYFWTGKKSQEAQMKYITLTEQEIADINRLLDKILDGNTAVDINDFLMEACIFSHELPERIRRFFYEFKLLESTFAICVKHNPILSNLQERTPDNLHLDETPLYASREEVLHILYCSLLGEVFSWSTQMGGRIINDIIPLKEYEDKLISLGSKYKLDIHTEDAFHPFMPDYFGLMCLRNPDRAVTLISSIDAVNLDPHIKEVLFRPRFIIKPNLAQKISLTESSYQPTSVLFGHEDSPYMRINAVSMHPVDGDEEARNALETLIQALRDSTVDVVLEPGDCLYINNYKTVHGRKPYRARYDGADRWLKRVYVTCDLRKSRACRTSAFARIITPNSASFIRT